MSKTSSKMIWYSALFSGPVYNLKDVKMNHASDHVSIFLTIDLTTDQPGDVRVPDHLRVCGALHLSGLPPALHQVRDHHDVIKIIMMTIIVRLHSQTSYLKMALPAIVFSIVFTLPTYFMLDNSCEKVNFSLAFRTWMRKTKNFPLWHLDNYISSWKLLRKMFRCSMVTTVTIMRTQWNSTRSLKR